MGVLSQDKVEEILEDVLNSNPNNSQFGLVGRVGSDYGHELHHDMDILFYPSKEASKGKFVSAQMDVILEMQNVLKEKYGSDVIPFPMLQFQGLIETYSGRKEGEFLMHNLTFTDMAAIEKRVPFFDKWLNKMKVIYGSQESPKEAHLTDMDFYYFTMINGQILLSRLSDKAVDNQAKTICNYVNKHVGNDQLIVPYNTELSKGKAVELFKLTIQELDKKARIVS